MGQTKRFIWTKIAALTKELFHAHYAGKLEVWFSYLTSDSIFLGTGIPVLIWQQFRKIILRIFLKNMRLSYRKIIFPHLWYKLRTVRLFYTGSKGFK